MQKSRRESLKKLGKGIAALPLASSTGLLFNACSGSSNPEQSAVQATPEKEAWSFDISIAQWSLHRAFFGDAIKLGWQKIGELLQSDPNQLLQGVEDPIDFPNIASDKFEIDAIELVNTFYFSKASDESFWSEYKSRCDGFGVKCLLIMCDAEGNLGDTNDKARLQAVENHYKWVNAAKILGCHSIRVNAAGEGTPEEVQKAAIDGLGLLSEYGAQNDINIIVENHGGYSSDGKWLSGIMKEVGSEYCGTLPDFGNFCIKRGPDGCSNEYDRYLGVSELMPYAKGVSAKTHEFDEQGNETNTDFMKMMQIVKEAGYSGYVGIEYEGQVFSEEEGILRTKQLLEKTREALV